MMDAMDTDNPNNDEDQMEELDEEDRRVAEEAQIVQPNIYSPKISQEEYEKQKKTYTEAAVKALMQTEEYMIKSTRCSSCWSIWYLGQSSHDCFECGGYGLERPCPVCDGKCNKTWIRDVDASHAFYEAHWDGECGLPVEEQRLLLLQKATVASEEAVLEGLQDLST